jgi:hypothetical protein
MTSCVGIILAAWAAAGPAGPGCACGQGGPPAYVQAVPAYEEGTRGQPAPRLYQVVPMVSQPASPYNSAPRPVMVPVVRPAVGPAAQLAAPLGSDEQSEPFIIEGDVQVLDGKPEPAPSQPDLLKNLKVARKYQDKVGHAEDYSWITGHLFYVRADGGRWVLRYTLPDQIDRFGGSVVLAPGVDMKNFREGDLVCVSGKVVDQGRASPSLGGALYRADTITMVERADP